MHNKPTDKRGVILVFVLILLSVLLSTALGFSYFIIADINKAKAVDDSIIAYYAADAGIEKSLYLLTKQEVTESLQELASDYPGESLATSQATWNIASSTDYEAGLLRQRLYNGQSVKFFILNRANGTSFTGLNTTKSISVEWYKGNGTPNLQVALTQLVPQTVDESLVYYTDTSEALITDSANPLDPGARCFDLKDVNVNNLSLLGGVVDYVAEFKVLGLSDLDFVDTLKVQAYNLPCNDQTWASSINSRGITNLTLHSKGRYGRSEQSIIAHIVPKNTLSGLLGFVLFSEQAITKE